MKEKKIYINIPVILALVVGLLGLFVGSFLDKDIATAVGKPDNMFTTIFSAIGPMPGIQLGVFSSAVLLLGPARKHKNATVIMRVAAILALLALTYFQCTSTSEYASYPPFNNHKTLFIVLIIAYALITNGLIVLFVWKYGKKLNQEYLFFISVLILSIVVLVAGATEFFKYLASRPRPVVVFSGEEEFRQWYQFKPLYALKNMDCRSFVSGHASNTANLMTTLPLFISLFPLGKKKYAQLIAFFGGAVYSLTTIVSRMLGQAHFLSDVSAGFAGSLIVQIVVMLVVPIIYTKIESKKTN